MDTKQKIMRAARHMFLTKGFEATTHEDIATTGGVNKALINYYFRSKENLYRQVVSSIISGEINPLVHQFLRESEIVKKISVLDKIGRILVNKYPLILTILINRFDPLHIRVLSQFKGMLLVSSHLYDKGEDQFVRTVKKYLILITLSTFPALFENFMKTALDLSNSQYVNIMHDYKNYLIGKMEEM